MMAERSWRVLIGTMTLVLVSSVHAVAQSQQVCRVKYTMDNRNRHVTGQVNAECPPNVHSVPWGNWGVASTLSDLVDGYQFFGWHIENNQGQWDSCTRDHIPDTDNIYYNHDHNGNGLGDDQWSPYENPYVGGAFVDYSTECPIDYNGDGYCDNGGCLGLNYGVGIGGDFLTLYELDPWNGDEFITTLNVGSGCCSVWPSCTAVECGSAQSGWYPSNANSIASTEVRMRMQFAVFQDLDNHCDQLKMWDPRYQCS